MAVSLTPEGLVGDRGGVIISTGTMASLGFSSPEGADIDIPLPTGYDFFHVFIRYRLAANGTNRGTLWFQVKDSGANRLSLETNSWQARRNGDNVLQYSTPGTWTQLGSFIDNGNWNYIEFTMDGKSVARPSITFKGNSTYGSVGSIYHYGSAHYGSTTQYRSVGLNCDDLDINGFEYRVIGYTL
tara:strand:- start:1782 stop:2336 length:555 start_codon:yes stop_codon:yes gene_type:complete